VEYAMPGGTDMLPLLVGRPAPDPSPSDGMTIDANAIPSGKPD
jgi:hypothetical protein